MKYVKHKQHIRRYADPAMKFIDDAWVLAHVEAAKIEGVDYSVIENSQTLFAAHEGAPVNFKYNITKDDSVLTIILRNETENRQLVDISIDLNNFANLAGQCVYTINPTTLKKNIEENRSEWMTSISTEIETPFLPKEPENINKVDIINAYGSTLATKSKVMYAPENVFSFFVTKDNPTPEDIVLVLIVPQEIENISEDLPYDDLNGNPYAGVDTTGWATHSVDVDTELEFGGVVGKLHESLMDAIDILNVTQSETAVTVTVQAADVDYIYLEQVSGFLAKTKIPVVNGTAEFKVSTIGLDAGDEIVTKIGYKYWSNHRTLTYTLV
jgi:hypothetical protein